MFAKQNRLDEAGIKTKHDGTKRTAFNLMSYDTVSRETINQLWPELSSMPDDVYEAIEIEAKYAGYLKRQQADIDVFHKDENLKIREDIDYSQIGGLSREMVQNCLKSARRPLVKLPAYPG